MDGLVEGACAQRVLYKIADSSLLYRGASRSTKFVVAQLRESLCNRGEWLMAVSMKATCQDCVLRQVYNQVPMQASRRPSMRRSRSSPSSSTSADPPSPTSSRACSRCYKYMLGIFEVLKTLCTVYSTDRVDCAQVISRVDRIICPSDRHLTFRIDILWIASCPVFVVFRRGHLTAHTRRTWTCPAIS
jgi:hypothetical protein